MEEKKAAVQMRDITKRFGPVLANDRVWLDIYKGEILALLGENGSGKTTLTEALVYFSASIFPMRAGFSSMARRR